MKKFPNFNSINKLFSIALVLITLISPLKVFAVAYNIADGVFFQIALNVSLEESTPYAMLFNNDGTKLYVTGAIGDDINEYTLSTPYDISSGTFTQIALSIAGQEATVTEMLFNNNGTKLYVMGTSGDDINEYTLSTPYDIHSGTFTRIALSVAGEEAVPTDMLFNNDGTKLYVMGSAGRDITEYTLSTPYDIHSGTFTQTALSVLSQENSPQSMLFNNDGTKLYVMGIAGDDINEYHLVDLISPTIQTFSPLDDAIDVAIDSNLVITFDEAVDRETGNITIKKASDDSTVEAIDVTSGLVTGTGTDTITINPTANFTNNTEYYIQIDATAFDDAAGNSYAGISNTTTWSFTTIAASTAGSGGGRSSSITSTCKPSSNAVSVGDKVSFDIDIDTTEDSYSFKWTKVLEGDDEEETHIFEEAGKYYPRGLAKDAKGNNIVVNCGTITVSEDDDSSVDNDENETDTTNTLIALVAQHQIFLRTLAAQGVELPQHVRDILASLTQNTGTTTTAFTVDLELGDTHPDVQRLQQFLIAQGYVIPAGVTDYFGVQTQAALIQFQITKEISPAAGYFGPKTRAVVNANEEL